VVVILQDGGVREMGAFVTGPIDFLVEIVSRGDRSRKKLPFYSKIGVREVLFVERKPWRLRLYRHDGEALKLTGACEIDAAPLCSEVLPFSFQLLANEERPALQITHADDGRTWKA
jgi:Uma2 family endonuclease